MHSKKYIYLKNLETYPVCSKSKFVWRVGWGEEWGAGSPETYTECSAELMFNNVPRSGSFFTLRFSICQTACRCVSPCYKAHLEFAFFVQRDKKRHDREVIFSLASKARKQTVQVVRK